MGPTLYLFMLPALCECYSFPITALASVCGGTGASKKRWNIRPLPEDSCAGYFKIQNYDRNFLGMLISNQRKLMLLPNNIEAMVRGFLSSFYTLLCHAVATSVHHKSDEQILAEYEIIKKCQSNPEYFAPLYRKYHEQLFLFINKRVDHLEITADLTSRVFLKCLKNIGKYKYQGVPFSAWLYKIAINEINTFFRQQKKMERAVNIDDHDIKQLISEIEYSEPQLDPHVLVPVLLEQLDEKDIQFIELRFFESRSFKEMGYLLGLTEVNAKVKTYRIINKLKKIASEIKYH